MQVPEPESLALTSSEVMALAVMASERDSDSAAAPDAVRAMMTDDDLYDVFIVGSFNGAVRLGVQIGDADNRHDVSTFDVSPNVWRFLIVRDAVSPR